jgi:hypothetical protein
MHNSELRISRVDILNFHALNPAVKSRDFNLGMTEAEVRLLVRNLAHFHAASRAMARMRRLDLTQHYGGLCKTSTVAGLTSMCVFNPTDCRQMSSFEL